MAYFKKIIESFLQEAKVSAFAQQIEDEVEVTPATQKEFGHYQCNQAMRYAKALKLSPREIAKKWVDSLESLPKSKEIFDKIEIAGPGFINFWLKPSFLCDEINNFHLKERASALYPNKRVLVDFSSPNTAKEMHVGHLRSTIIGDSLARVFEFVGCEVLRVNHVGDWGTQFGMLIAYLERSLSQADFHRLVEGESVLTLQDLVASYKEAKKQFDEDETFKELSKKRVIDLQAHEKNAYGVWQGICEISRRAYQEIYDTLGVKIEERGESTYNEFLAPIVSEYTEKGYAEESEGAKCIFVDGFKVPFMIQKSDGGFNYDTTDLAALRFRVKEQKAERIIYVTDAGQALHFKLLFAVGEKSGEYDPEKIELDHVPFGVVLGPDGKKFKTRSGETERLMDLIDRAVGKAESILKEREPKLSEEVLQTRSRALGISAIKYADLSNDRIGDYTFSYDKMLQFEGNTAAFILYSYVRSLGIERRLLEEGREPLSGGKIQLMHESEIELALLLLKFDEAIHGVINGLAPHRLADYLYQLAQTFNAFFRDCQVAGDPNETSRRLLTQKTSEVIKAGCDLLGLQCVDRM